MMIITSGVIGAGKSSLATMIGDVLGTEVFYESVEDNPVLPLFYANPDQYAFLLQVYFLNTRFDSIKKAMKHDNNVLDRSIYEDSLFFHMNADMGRATKTEVEVYDALLANMMEELPYAAHKKAPDLLVHIEISLDTMLKRIQKRGREFEQIENDPSLLEYYTELIRRYEQWYEDYDYSPKIKINGDKIDFVENPVDANKAITLILLELLKLDKLSPLEITPHLKY